MKAETTVPNVRRKRQQYDALPDPPVTQNGDLPRNLPPVTQSELNELLNAMDILRVAQADFDIKRGKVALKLLSLCRVERGSDVEAELDPDGKIILTDSSSAGWPRIHRV